MSLDIFLQRFGADDGNDRAVSQMLVPMIVERDGGWARIVTEDGSAEGQRGDLPDDVPVPIRVVRTGAELRMVVLNS